VSARIHPLAEVESGAELGEGVVVWRHTHVMSGARIGARSMLAQGCFVAARVIIGEGCRIQNNVSLYDGVELASDVFVGPSAVFTNVRVPRAAYPKKPSYAVTRIGQGASIGANATIVCGVVIGARSFVAAGAVVTRDVPEHAVVLGSPARITGWICACGAMVVRGVARPTDATCPQCHQGPAGA